MSIAELIMTGTERASKSTDWVADSLAKIGDNVTKVLREREQQKQAQEMLPMFQQSMQESMKKAGEGKSGEAYSILMPFLTDPSVARNPFMMPALEAGIKMNQIAADDFLRQSQINAYKDRYAAKTGGGGFDPQTILDTMNQDGGGDILTVDETVNPEGINPVVAGALPATLINPQNVQSQRGMGMTPRSMAAQAEATGLPAVTPTGTPQTREEIDAAAAAGLPAATPTTPTAPGIGAVRGVTPENALFPDLQITEPPKNVLEKFIRFEDKFAALPFEKQKAEMDNNSILFPDQKMLADYKPSKGRGIIQLSPEASVGIPGLVGAVEIPDKYKQYILGNVNINPSTGSRSYSLRPEVENDPEAKAALAWLQDWQNASIEVNSNPKLRDLLAKAGNDALAIDIEPIGKGELDGQNMVELSVRGNPDTKIQVFKETADQIKVLRSQTGAANVHNAKFIRLKGEEPAAKTQAPTQGGMPAVQAGAAKATQQAAPEELDATNPFAKKVSEQRASQQITEAETSKTQAKDTIASLETKLKVLEKLATRKGFQPDDAANYKDYQDTKKKLDTLKQISVAQSEGRVFASEQEARNSNKKFNKGTTIYIAGKPAVVQ
jgi:hypothetical protein